jgi:hypothetical protein
MGVLAFEAYNLFNTRRITGINTLAYVAAASLPVNQINGPYSGALKPVAGAGTGNHRPLSRMEPPPRRCQLAFQVIF